MVAGAVILINTFFFVFLMKGTIERGEKSATRATIGEKTYPASQEKSKRGWFFFGLRPQKLGETQTKKYVSENFQTNFLSSLFELLLGCLCQHV